MNTLIIQVAMLIIGMIFVYFMGYWNGSQKNKSNTSGRYTITPSPVMRHGVKPPTTAPRPPAPPSQNPKKHSGVPAWLDMDAEYFVLEDTNRTPLKIVSIKSGVVKLESENMSHCFTCGLNIMHEVVTIINK